jgi:hypothetical protein
LKFNAPISKPSQQFSKGFSKLFIFIISQSETLPRLAMSSNLRSTSTQEQHEVKLRTFQDDIVNAVERAFLLRAAPDASGYTKVVVQFFHFINNDIVGVAGLEKELGNIFRDRYRYEVRYTILGKDRSYASVSLEVSSILIDISKTHGSAGSLVIVVYSGHGRTKFHNGQQQLEVS